MRSMLPLLLVLAIAVSGVCGGAQRGMRWVVEEEIKLARVPAGFPVNFCLLTSGQHQFAAYYDQDRRMTVAMRKLGSRQWQRKVLPSRIGWDSHNFITMELDGGGHLHLAGNMHADPLVYFRSAKPWDVNSLQPHAMTGELEGRATYPHFLKDDRGRLLFHYRHGGSGNGVRIWNRYDEGKRKWTRLHDSPLLDGRGRSNAYPGEIQRGPDGRFHMAWVWRDTPDCATNHHLSYARSRDLVHWESATGDKVELPITPEQKSLWVDPIPSGGGIINGGFRMVFDITGTPLVVYHKSDQAGHMQLYAARAGKNGWQRRQLTEWKQPVKFGGRGSMGFIGIRLGEVRCMPPGILSVAYRHKDYGSGRLWIDANSLRPATRASLAGLQDAGREGDPVSLGKLTSKFKGMSIRRANDAGKSGEEGVRYLLQWETLGPNHDRPRQPPLPEPSLLRLYKLRSVR